MPLELPSLTHVAYSSLRVFYDGGLRLFSHEQNLWMTMIGEVVEPVEPVAQVHFS